MFIVLAETALLRNPYGAGQIERLLALFFHEKQTHEVMYAL
jgi:hypothetical protein